MEQSFDRVARRIPRFGERLLRLPEEIRAQATDIRLAAGKPLSVCGREGIYYVSESGGVRRAVAKGLLTVTREDLRDVFMQACAQSVFSHERELAKGYVMMENLCRVGVCGTAVIEGGMPRGVREITSLVFRIPRDVPGCADRFFHRCVRFSRGVLVAGEPSSGKTTLLRDLARSLSVGKFQPPRRVAVLDEKGELSGGYDLGPNTDVLRGYPKALGFEIALKNLSPEYILLDELSPEDLPAVREAAFSGAALIASLHGSGKETAFRALFRALFDTGAFETAVLLRGRGRPGEIADIVTLGDIQNAEAHGKRASGALRTGDGASESRVAFRTVPGGAGDGYASQGPADPREL